MKNAHVITLMAILLAVQAANAASIGGSNTGNVTIPDAGGYVSSTITISGAPAGAVVTGIDVYFKCVHTYSGDLTVDLNADSTGSLGNYRLWNREGGSADNPTRTTTGISTFNGLSVNRTWYLYAKDWAAGDTGYIDEWTITIYYADPTTYAITPNPATVSEGVGTLTFTITRSGGTPAETIYASTTQTEGYANNGDYATNVNNLPVSFTSGQTTRTVTVSITNDTTYESSETFGFIVQRNTSDPVTTYLAKSTFTITDDDPLPEPNSVILEVPYIHQCYDTNDNFVGSWACAPTSAVMVLAYYGRISPHPMWVSSPSPGHYSNYGWYVSNEYSYGSHTFSNEHSEHVINGSTNCGDANGKGAWGYIWQDSSSSCVSCGVITNLQDYLSFHDLTVDYNHYDESSARNLVQQEIDNNRPLIARTSLGSGHYVVVVGYEIDASGNFYYKVNDPFGDEPYGDICWGDYGIQQPVTYSYSQMGLSDPTRGLITIAGVPLVADLDMDGDVDFTDLLILANQWLQPPGTPSADIAPQPNGDGIVNFLDFALMAENWMK